MPYKDKELGKQKKREYYAKNKERLKLYSQTEIRREAVRNNDIRRRHGRKEAAVAFLGGKCVDCQQSYPLPCYDFHHINPNEKDFDPCSGLTKSKEIFYAELAKCVLLCSNCHRIRHSKYDTK